MKRALRTLLTSKLGLWLSSAATLNAIPILMLHRFSVPELGIRGHSPSLLRRRLSEMRQHGFEPLSLAEAINTLEHGGHAKKTVVFTVDDGYADFALAGAPVFQEFDCPVTVFLTTGFVDGALWLWWDKLEYILESAGPRLAVTYLEAIDHCLGWQTVGERQHVLARFVERLKSVPNDRRERALTEVAQRLGTSTPPKVPERYAPITWPDVVRLERLGFGFGPHSVSHPILAQLPDAQLSAEVTGSWERLSRMSQQPVQVFCYPNGRAGDFGAREVSLLRNSGFRAALATIPGVADRSYFDTPRSELRFALPRVPYFEDRVPFWLVVGGMERLRRRLGGQSSPPRSGIAPI